MDTTQRFSQYLPWMILLIAIISYSGMALYQLDLPGLHHDEAQEGGRMGMQLHQGIHTAAFRDATVTVLGRNIPLMVQDYIGSLYVVIAWIAFGVGGVSVESLRAASVVIGALTILAGFLASRRLFDAQTAALCAILVAVHPAFIFWTRQGVYVTSYILLLGLLALWLLVRWYQGGKAYNLMLAAFLMGVGLWGKLLFIWLMGGIFIAWIMLNLPQWWQNRRFRFRPEVNTPLWTIAVAIVCGIAGIAPLLMYNSQTGGTFDSIFNNLDSSYYGVDNGNVGENFRERLRQTPLVYESGHLRELGGIFKNPVARFGLGLGLLGLLIGAWRTNEQRGARLFLLIVVLLMIAQSSFTSTALWFTHFALVLPLMIMVVVAGLLAWRDLNPRLLWAGFAMIALLGIGDLNTTQQYHARLTETGGIATHSAAIYPLAEELDQYPIYHPVAALDWGISPAIEMLTEARIVPNEVFGYTWEPDDGFAARLAPFFALDASLYVLHVDSETVFPRRDAFFTAASEAGRDDLELITVINNRQGNPYFEIWGVGE